MNSKDIYISVISAISHFNPKLNADDAIATLDVIIHKWADKFRERDYLPQIDLLAMFTNELVQKVSEPIAQVLLARRDIGNLYNHWLDERDDKNLLVIEAGCLQEIYAITDLIPDEFGQEELRLVIEYVGEQCEIQNQIDELQGKLAFYY